MLLRQVLLPIARLCVRRSVRLQELVDVLKRALVDAAREQLEREGKEATGAKLSMITGVHRKDLKNFASGPDNESLRRHPIVRCLSLWTSDDEFCDEQGNPRVLTTGEGPGSFAALARRVGGDPSRYSLLYALEREGFVTKQPSGEVKLERTHYLDPGSGWDLLGELIDDGIACIEHNLTAPSDLTNLHLKTVFDNIPSRFSEQLRKEIREKGSRFQDEIRALLSHYDRDINAAMREYEDPPAEISCSIIGVVKRLPY